MYGDPARPRVALESGLVPAPRRLRVLLSSGLVALALAAPGFAQSAEGRQAVDPSIQAQNGSSPGAPPPLTPEPQPSETPSGDPDPDPERPDAGSNAGSGSGSGRPTPPPPDASDDSAGSGAAPVVRTELPNTGADAGVVGLLGAALVLLGIGLRLRVADARR